MNSYTPGDNPYDFDLPDRDDLQLRGGYNGLDPFGEYGPVTDNDLRKLGYIKVDVDIDALREALTDFYPFGIPTIPSWPNSEIEGHVSFLVELGVEVLAALDKGNE